MAAEKRGTPVSVTHPNAYRVEVYEKRRYAAKLAREGWSWDEIAEEVGYASRGAAHSAVRILLQESRDLAYDEADLYRTASLERLMKLLKAVWPKAMAGDDKSVSQARLLISQMDDLTGVKAPIQVEIGESDVDRLLREAEAELGRRTAAAQVQAGRVQADPGADHSG